MDTDALFGTKMSFAIPRGIIDLNSKGMQLSCQNEMENHL